MTDPVEAQGHDDADVGGDERDPDDGHTDRGGADRAEPARAPKPSAKDARGAKGGAGGGKPTEKTAADRAVADRLSVADSDEERWRRNKANIKTILGAIALAFFIRIVLFEAFEIDGPSMEPTLLNGDRVVVAKFPYGLFLPFTNEAVISWGMPSPGDVVIVKSPLDDIDIVKRVIGVPGDRIEIRDDVVYRNGVALLERIVGPCPEAETTEVAEGCETVEEHVGERSWHTSRSPMGIPSESMSPVLVPEGHIFVLGDHRDRSNDSRNPRVGMIPIARVKGRALAIYWSNEVQIRWDRIFSEIR